MSFFKDFIKVKNPTQTVFTFSELNNQVTGYSGAKLKSALKYSVQKKDLHRISKGIYATSPDYSHQEFANKFVSPSYISLYTILSENGIVFQPYPSIYLVSDRSKEIIIDGHKYIYRKIKDLILLNPFGINQIGNVHKATIERAICDLLYLNGLEYFDNLRSVDWNLIKQLNQQVFEDSGIIDSFIQKNSS